MDKEFTPSDGEKHEAVEGAEAILSGNNYAVEQKYGVILPTETIGVFTKTLFDYIDVHKDPILQRGAMREEAQGITNSENPHMLLLEKLQKYPKTPELTIFPVNSREVDILTEAVLFDISSIDPQGYEWHLSEGDHQRNKMKADGFMDFLHAFVSAGGEEKPNHIAELKRSIQQSEDDQLRSEGWM